MTWIESFQVQIIARSWHWRFYLKISAQIITAERTCSIFEEPCLQATVVEELLALFALLQIFSLFKLFEANCAVFIIAQLNFFIGLVCLVLLGLLTLVLRL